MILTCPSCGSRFQIPDGALGAAGRKVKCSACQHVWFQAPEGRVADPPPAPAAGQATPDISPPPEPNLAPKPDAVVAPVPPAEEPAPDTEAEEITSSLVVAKTVTDVEAPQAPDPHIPGSDEQTADEQTVNGPTAEMPRPGTADGVAANEAPSFDVTRVVGPDDGADDRPSRRRFRAIALVVLLLVAAGAALYQWRVDVLQAVPETLPAYAAIGLVGPPSSQNLKLEDVAFEVVDEDGNKVLIVSGRVVNAGPDLSLLPMLRAELLDQAGQVTTFWTFVATAEVLGPGAHTGFRDIYPDPPVTGDETDILVTFDDLR